MWKISFSNPILLNKFKGGGDQHPTNLLNAQNTEKLLSALRAAEIYISTSSEEADEDTKLPKLPIIPLIKKIQM